jgi:hypothetical protein
LKIRAFESNQRAYQQQDTDITRVKADKDSPQAARRRQIQGAPACDETAGVATIDFGKSCSQMAMFAPTADNDHALAHPRRTVFDAVPWS